MLKTLVRVFAYILTIGGVGGYFLLRSNLAFVAMLLGVVLFALTEIETLKKFKPGDTKKDWLGMTIIDLDKIKEREKQKTEPKIELRGIRKCKYCGTEYNLSEYHHDAPEWLCAQCKKALPKE
jgi:hypothetical protein